jgi:hypothetical protein
MSPIDIVDEDHAMEKKHAIRSNKEHVHQQDNG